MNILGIHEFTHDVGAALITEADIFAYEEERFSRQKHHYGFERGGGYPHKSVQRCLEHIDRSSVDKAYLSWETNVWQWFRAKSEMMRCYQAAGLVHQYTRNSYARLAKLVYQNYTRRRKCLSNLPFEVTAIPHHLAHASYAYRTSSMTRALVIILDGAGESESGSVYLAENNHLTLKKQYPISQSIGTLYAIATRILGLGRDAEGKTMGLSSHGTPIEGIKLVHFNSTEDKFAINYNAVSLLRQDLESLPDNSPEREARKRDIAATLQREVSNTLLDFFKYCTEKYKERNVCFAGGVALNCVFNGQLLHSGIVDNLYVPSAPSDCGVALGAALEGKSRQTECYALDLPHAFLGSTPDQSNEIDTNFPLLAKDLALGKVVAVCRGRAELGPRALGHRSILASASNPKMHYHLNTKVKNREQWRPYGIALLEEEVERLFGVRCEAPFMNVALKANALAKMAIPGCIHVDGTVRIQTITERNNEYMYRILQEYKKCSGYGAIINTSFNSAGEPIVNTSQQAITAYESTAIDVLYLSGQRHEKASQTRQCHEKSAQMPTYDSAQDL